MVVPRARIFAFVQSQLSRMTSFRGKNMSAAVVKTVARRFLNSETPEVLAIKGAWGVGKTFAWNQLLLQNKNNCKLPSYCYVSLFGISSIAELRTAIFAKTTAVSSLGEHWDSRTTNKKWVDFGLESIKGWSHQLSKFKDC